MSLKETREQLIQLLEGVENRVIALSGKWGTGKTHLWDEVKKTSKDDKVKNAIYVSLFGLSSIDQIKRKLIESAIPGRDLHGRKLVLTKLFSKAIGAFSEHYKVVATLNDLSLLLAPKYLEKAVIVMDDIERKHDKLGIDEILGFIDEFSKQHESRFVLVLNDDQLTDPVAWNTLREKAIDQEIRLLTTAEEAFSIAIGLTPSRYTDSIKQASIVCRLTNIRIVGKVIRVANQILSDRELEEALLARVIPSIVLFSAIHYKGLEDGPDFQFALNIGSHDDWVDFSKEGNEEPNPEMSRRGKWRLLMNELGIQHCDEFEALVVEHLESGLFDATKLTPIIERYIEEKQNLEAREKANRFLKDCYWNHYLNENQLIEMAAGLPAIAGLFDPFLASELEQALATLDGGAAIGNAIIDNWIASLKIHKQYGVVNEDNLFNRPLHKKIVAEFANVEAHVQAQTNVLEACLHLIEHNGWGTLQILVLKRATAVDFEAVIRNMDIEDLRRFMRKMIEMRLQRQTYDQHFGSATERFVEACRNIANDANSSRLAGLIKRLFAESSLAAELTLQQVQSAPINSTQAQPDGNPSFST